MTYGKLGECCFQLGDVAAAVDPTATALRLCEEQGDEAGVLAYLGNLFEMHRYLGRQQAQLVRAGEPLNRVVVMVDGDQCELDDLHNVGQGRVQFVFKRNRLTLEPARRRTSEGEQLGGQGRHDDALVSFREAARLDPFDPHPRFQSGLALLHLRRYAEAVAEYEAAERAARGAAPGSAAPVPRP